MVLREKDQKSLDEFLAFLETRGMRAELRGSAAAGSQDYRDLDLNLWDAQEKGPGYKLGREAIDRFLKDLGVKDAKHRYPIMATWCEGQWTFEFNGTKFDIIYTPGEKRFTSY